MNSHRTTRCSTRHRTCREQLRLAFFGETMQSRCRVANPGEPQPWPCAAWISELVKEDAVIATRQRCRCCTLALSACQRALDKQVIIVSNEKAVVLAEVAVLRPHLTGSPVNVLKVIVVETAVSRTVPARQRACLTRGRRQQSCRESGSALACWEGRTQTQNRTGLTAKIAACPSSE